MIMIFPKNQMAANRLATGIAMPFISFAAGRGDIAVGGRSSAFKKGDLIYVPPGVLHSFSPIRAAALQLQYLLRAMGAAPAAAHRIWFGMNRNSTLRC